MSNDKFVPEIGRPCLYKFQDKLHEAVYCGRSSVGDFVIETNYGCKPVFFPVTEVFPIKSEAEKRRDDAVAEMKAVFHKNACLPGDVIFETIHDAGWVKPKPLTYEAIDALIIKHQDECETLSTHEFARMVEAYIRGEVE